MKSMKEKRPNQLFHILASIVFMVMVSIVSAQPVSVPVSEKKSSGENSPLPKDSLGDSSNTALDSGAQAGNVNAAVTSQRNPHKKLPAKAPWEHIVSAPGYVINAPFWLLNKTVEKTIYYVDENKIVPKVKRILISEDGTRVIMPTYDVRVGSGLKITKSQLFSDSSLSAVGLSHGLDSRRGAYLYLLDNPLLGSSTFDFKTEYQNLYDVEFYGWGPDTKPEDEGEYSNSQLEVDLLFKFPVTSGLTLGMGPGYRYHNIRNYEEDEEPILSVFPELPYIQRGFEPDLNLGNFEIGFIYNSLTPLGHPLTGIRGEFKMDYYYELGKDKYRFAVLESDYKQSFHLFYDRSFQIRLNASLVRAFKGRNLPFYYLSELGETGTIRGYERGRFRDRDRVMGNLEYRYPIWSPEYRVLEAVVFVDGGQVTSDIFRRLSWDKMRYGYGFGIRAYSSKNRVLSWEFAFSEEGFQAYFLLN